MQTSLKPSEGQSPTKAPRKESCDRGAACVCRKSGWKGSGCLIEDRPEDRPQAA